MKKSNFLLLNLSVIFFIGILLIQYGCKVEENKPPTCTITYPENESEISFGVPVNITVEATDEDGKITEVRFEIDDVAVKIDDTSPYDYEWSTASLELGNHTIRATATDNDGESTTDEVTVSFIIETGSVTDYDGNVYTTIKIGDQWWMAENLRTTHYADGAPLVDGTGEGYIWSDDITKYYFAYNDDESYVPTFGRLYTWSSVMNGSVSSITNPSGVQGIAPDGWHIPSDDEWKELEIFLGMTQSQADDSGWWRGSDEGGKLKETGANKWISPNNGATNASGFTAIPSGIRDYIDGDFSYLYYKTYFWSSSEYSDSYVWYRYLSYDDSRIYRSTTDIRGGLSVRCIKN